MKISHSNLFIGFFLLVGLMITGCTKDTPNTSSLYVPTSEDVTANATLLELQQGRALYVDNCASCHSLYAPDDYNASQWQDIMASMTPETHLSAAEALLVKKYVSRGK
jgi:mono/diheme cytochrome c family protein